MTRTQRASGVLSRSPVDLFYPVVSLLAFLSGACFGFYYAWRQEHLKVAPQRQERDQPEPLRRAA